MVRSQLDVPQFSGVKVLNKKDVAFDVNVEVSFDRRSYRGKSKKDNTIFRLVAVYNSEADEHHFYITNISPDILDASEIAAIYAARWEIELIFKELNLNSASCREYV